MLSNFHLSGRRMLGSRYKDIDEAVCSKNWFAMHQNNTVKESLI